MNSPTVDIERLARESDAAFVLAGLGKSPTKENNTIPSFNTLPSVAVIGSDGKHTNI